jgi:hypothetical protein
MRTSVTGKQDEAVRGLEYKCSLSKVLKYSSSSSSSSGQEIRPKNDLFRPHDCMTPVVSLMIIHIFFR